MFVYITTTGPVVSGSNPNLGLIGLGYQYDPLEDDFDSSREFINYEGTVFAPTSTPVITMGVECKMDSDPLNWYFCDENDGDDLRFNDHGRFVLMADGQPTANYLCGKVIVTYEIEFSVPKANPSPSMYYHLTNDTGINANDPLGTSDSMIHQGPLPMTITDSGAGDGDTLNFPTDIDTGNALVIYTCTGDSTASLAVTFSKTSLDNELVEKYFTTQLDRDWET